MKFQSRYPDQGSVWFSISVILCVILTILSTLHSSHAYSINLLLKHPSWGSNPGPLVLEWMHPSHFKVISFPSLLTLSFSCCLLYRAFSSVPSLLISLPSRSSSPFALALSHPFMVFGNSHGTFSLN